MSNDAVTCEVKGLDQLQAALEDLGDKQAKAIVRDATRAGGKAAVDAFVQSAGGVHGEPGEMLRNPMSWKMRYKSIRDALAGSVKISATGTLPETHKGTGRGIQPKDRLYHRSLAYLVKLLELGSGGGAYRGQRYPVMTSAFDSNQQNILDKMIAVIQAKLERVGK
ncbi:MAG TPA: hypothetical protein VMR80_10560 [Candidatus Acidoferrum sp.]|nr:hypothetical protein [Candidatus Acidoferrum sp.]